MRPRRRATDYPMAPVERFDHPAAPGVEAYVPGPPENVAGAYVLEGHLRQLGGDRVGRSRQAYSRHAPGSLNETRAIEAGGTRTAPAIALAHLG